MLGIKLGLWTALVCWASAYAHDRDLARKAKNSGTVTFWSSDTTYKVVKEQQ